MCANKRQFANLTLNRRGDHHFFLTLFNSICFRSRSVPSAPRLYIRKMCASLEICTYYFAVGKNLKSLFLNDDSVSGSDCASFRVF